MILQKNISLNRRRRASGGTPIDPDAQAFITATGITDPTQIDYVVYLVGYLKDNDSSLGGSLWSRGINIKPNVGGTALAHSKNLIDPNTFEEQYVGSPTHNSLGVVYNGTTQHSYCGFIANDEITLTVGAQGVYTQAGWTGSYMIGAINVSGGVKRFGIDKEYYDAGNAFQIGSAISGGERDVVINGVLGFKGYIDGSEDATNATVVAVLPTIETYAGAANLDGSPLRSAGALSFYYQGLYSPSDVSLLYTIIHAAQTILGREV